jgi:LmbE family N-acetylglucosaminyl deacetylase
MTDRRMLLVLAHPDDESFGSGALIAKYVSEGVQVDLICATNGDAGSIDPEHLDGYESPAALRLAELECASQILGFSEVITLGYRDSGMMGAADNDNSDSLWYAWQNKPEEVTRRVVEVIRKRQPQVVLTFNKYGGYGHPDHIAIQQAATDAFYLAGDPDYITDGQAPYAPQKLVYGSFPTLMLRVGIWWMRLRGKNPRKVGRNHDIDLVKILDYVEPVHTRVDITEFLDIWEQANACHASQGGGRGGGLIPGWMRRMLGVKQGYTRIHPTPAQNRVDEHDLFDNVTIEEPVTT